MAKGRQKGFSPGPIYRVAEQEAAKWFESRCAGGYYFTSGRPSKQVRLASLAEFLKAVKTSKFPVRCFINGVAVGRVRITPAAEPAAKPVEKTADAVITATAAESALAQCRTINLTPTWQGLMPSFFAVLESGTEQGKKSVREELMRLAGFGDKLNGKSLCDRCDLTLAYKAEKVVEWIRSNEGKILAYGITDLPGGAIHDLRQEIEKRREK